MLDRLLPRRIDNDHRGHGLAPWLFALVVLVQAGQGLMSILMVLGLALSLRSPGSGPAQG